MQRLTSITTLTRATPVLAIPPGDIANNQEALTTFLHWFVEYKN
jgi:hypothetical protein